MYSVYGVYENGKITLKQALPKNLRDASNVLVTFVESETRTVKTELTAEPGQTESPDEEKNEAYYQSIREFERVKAFGNITIIDQDKQYTFPLNDYSQGGLSFIAENQFDVGHMISAGITDPASPELVLMELQMEVRGIFKTDDGQFKVGCMFLDPVDEDLWHGLLQYLS